MNKKYLKYKIRYIFLVGTYGFLLIFSLVFLFTQSRYESQVELNAKIESAKHIINPGNFSFNIEMSKIIPREEPYVYIFYLSNYNDEEQSEVNMEYSINVKTTTNMPLRFELYKNQNYTDSDAVNIFDEKLVIQDEDGAWYNSYDLINNDEFLYDIRELDTYYLVVYYDELYKEYLNYADYIDSVKVNINARQIISEE